MKWIKASERLPETFDLVHIKANFDGRIYPEGARYSPQFKEWTNGFDGRVIEWLDESPSSDREEGNQDELWKEAIDFIFDSNENGNTFPMTIDQLKSQYSITKKPIA